VLEVVIRADRHTEREKEKKDSYRKLLTHAVKIERIRERERKKGENVINWSFTS